MQRFQFLKLAVAAVIAVPLLLSGCGDKKTAELKVGATAGPHAANVQKAAEVAKKQGLNVKVIEFTDYIQPNMALSSHEVDANFFANVPYQNNYNRYRNLSARAVPQQFQQAAGYTPQKYRCSCCSADGFLFKKYSQSEGHS